MKRALVIVPVLLTLAAGAQGASMRPLLALTTTGIARVEPVTLRPVGRPLRLPFNWYANALSPDRSQLAIGGSNASGTVRLVDLKRMRAVRDLRFTGVPDALFWLQPRLLVVQFAAGRVVAVDPTTKHVRWHRQVAGSIFSLERLAHGVVLLVAPDYHIGATRLVSITPTGVFRSVALDRILAGSRQVGASSSFNVRWPGVAVDSAGRHAFVVGAGEPIAEVDLATMHVTYHGGSRRLAKSVDGPSREARWLGNGLIAVVGTESHRWVDGQGDQQWTMEPAGLALVDTREWTTREVDPSASSVVVGSGLLLATGQSYDSTHPEDPTRGEGLAAYGLDGSPRFHVLDGPVGQLQVVRGVAYAWLGPGAHSALAVVDLASGRIIDQVSSTVVLQLLPDG
jgi:hypothetical protein